MQHSIKPFSRATVICQGNMKIITCFLCVGFFGMSFSFPSHNGYRRGPQRAVMISGYYNPLFSRNYDYVPQGSMSAVVTRDTVATNSFAGAQPPLLPIPTDDLPLEENEDFEPYTEKVDSPVQSYLPPDTEGVSQEAIGSEEVAIAEEVSTQASAVTKATKKSHKRITKKPTKDEDDEESLSAVWPFSAGKGAVPSYNAFFPITISGGGIPARSRAGAEQEDYYPGSATAIANSFSTGKGGIATSHATSFGDPYLASLVRNGLLNFRSKKPQNA